MQGTNSSAPGVRSTPTTRENFVVTEHAFLAIYSIGYPRSVVLVCGLQNAVAAGLPANPNRKLKETSP